MAYIQLHPIDVVRDFLYIRYKIFKNQTTSYFKITFMIIWNMFLWKNFLHPIISLQVSLIHKTATLHIILTLISGGALSGEPSVPRQRILARSNRNPSTWYSTTLQIGERRMNFEMCSRNSVLGKSTKKYIICNSRKQYVHQKKHGSVSSNIDYFPHPISYSGLR